MGKVEIIKLAREVGAIKRYWGANKEGFAFESDTQLERFAALVAANEREACAKVCDDIGDSDNGYGCAAAIQAMGKK